MGGSTLAPVASHRAEWPGYDATVVEGIAARPPPPCSEERWRGVAPGASQQARRPGCIDGMDAWHVTTYACVSFELTCLTGIL